MLFTQKTPTTVCPEHRHGKAVCNCKRDEGGPLGFGDQEPILNRHKLLSLRAMVVSVVETARHDLVRYDLERRAKANC